MWLLIAFPRSSWAGRTAYGGNGSTYTRTQMSPESKALRTRTGKLEFGSAPACPDLFLGQGDEYCSEIPGEIIGRGFCEGTENLRGSPGEGLRQRTQTLPFRKDSIPPATPGGWGEGGFPPLLSGLNRTRTEPADLCLATHRGPQQYLSLAVFLQECELHVPFCSFPRAPPHSCSHWSWAFLLENASVLLVSQYSL